jgi:hypothetical protein
MHPRLQELVDHLDLQRARLREAVDEVPREKRTVSPPNGGWSVAQVLEHLSLLEPRLAGMFRKRVSEAQAAGLKRETDTSAILPTFDIAPLLDRERKIPAPDPIQPKGNLDPDEAWTALERARDGLKAVIAEIDGWALGDVTHTHAIFGSLTLYQWIAFVGGHEARHAAQIREIGQAVKSGQADPSLRSG